jgi:LmbE family N-acetylglucosaminyl deacetylase|tara:strand:+ start:210 stop:1016 length:807 start_codon:yes stop_codon:yes gene_type:complete
MNIIYKLIRKFYRKRQNTLISNYYKILNSLNSTTPALLDLKNIQKVLVLAPHPDDEAIGCGGTLLQLTENNYHGEIIYFTNGREKEHNQKQDIAITRRKEAMLSSKKLGISQKHFLDYYDGHLKPDKDVVAFVLSRLNELKPDIVFTPFFTDNHFDHRETANILALSSAQYEGNFLCCCYELWSTLTPNYIVDITSFMDRKIESIKLHKSQTAETNFVDLAKGLNRYRAIVSGQPFQYAEAFFVASKRKYIKTSKRFNMFILSFFILL